MSNEIDKKVLELEKRLNKQEKEISLIISQIKNITRMIKRNANQN